MLKMASTHQFASQNGDKPLECVEIKSRCPGLHSDHATVNPTPKWRWNTPVVARHHPKQNTDPFMQSRNGKIPKEPN